MQLILTDIAFIYINVYNMLKYHINNNILVYTSLLQVQSYFAWKDDVSFVNNNKKYVYHASKKVSFSADFL